MWHTLAATTSLYRVTRPSDKWGDVLQGLGSFFASVGRSSGPSQQTVYATEDPLVALTEWAWHAALNFCDDIGCGNVIPSPLSRLAKLWHFVLASDIELVDVSHESAANRFGYHPHAPFNPHPTRYAETQKLADAVRTLLNPPSPHTRPEGLLAPSVRTPESGAYDPQQVALFVFPSPAVVPRSLAERAELTNCWDVELEFETPHGLAATQSDTRIAWSNPRYRLTGNANPVPKFAGRPRSRVIATDKWHPLTVQYSPY